MIFALIEKHLRWIILGIGIALAVVALLFLGRCDNAQQREAGATAQRESNLTETVKNVEKANEARDEIRNDTGDARYQQCLRTARTPANCQRLLPERQADQR